MPDTITITTRPTIRSCENNKTPTTPDQTATNNHNAPTHHIYAKYNTYVTFAKFATNHRMSKDVPSKNLARTSFKRW